MKRYKSTYQSHKALADAWAGGTLSPHGDFFKASNMVCDHNKIYSWGTHFCIAEKTANGLVLLTERTRSSSTAKHKSHVQRAVFRFFKHDKIVYVPSLDTGHGFGPKEWMRDALDRACSYFQKAKRARTMRLYKLSHSIELFNRATVYSKNYDLPLPTPAALPPGYLDFLAVESFKAKADQPTTQPFPTLHPCYTETRHALAA